MCLMRVISFIACRRVLSLTFHLKGKALSKSFGLKCTIFGSLPNAFAIARTMPARSASKLGLICHRCQYEADLPPTGVFENKLRLWCVGLDPWPDMRPVWDGC